MPVEKRNIFLHETRMPYRMFQNEKDRMHRFLAAKIQRRTPLLFFKNLRPADSKIMIRNK